jgi:hypothetical protein
MLNTIRFGVSSPARPDLKAGSDYSDQPNIPPIVQFQRPADVDESKRLSPLERVTDMTGLTPFSPPETGTKGPEWSQQVLETIRKLNPQKPASPADEGRKEFFA